MSTRETMRKRKPMNAVARWRGRWAARKSGSETGAVLTLKELRAAEACGPQRDRFREVFGDRVVVTEALAERWALRFDAEWAARRVLGDVAAYDELCERLRLESGVAGLRHGYIGGGDHCDACNAERVVAATAFARRFIAERGGRDGG